MKKSRCGQSCEIYTRIVGYFRPKKQSNKGKLEEINERANFKFNLDLDDLSLTMTKTFFPSV
jgi:ribonucleoside-triphosphate reductase